jgi:hypothetical protein
MNTTFETGNVVRANVSEQGMAEGNLYTITDVEIQSTPFGGFVTYSLTSKQRFHLALADLKIGNGHMLLTLVAR